MARRPAAKPAPRPSRNRSASIDDSGTRAKLVEVAGQLFAEKGFDRVTSKEICKKAGANIAAVNYHFNGIEGLHAAVLDKAHGRIFSLAALSAAVEGKVDAKAKLQAVLGLIVQAILGPASSTWALRVISREIAAPSRAMEILREKEIVPKSRILKQIVGELMDLPPDHPAVARGCISMMGPCAMLLIGDRKTIGLVLPSLSLQTKDAPSLVRHLLTFTLAGLRAVGAEERRQGS